MVRLESIGNVKLNFFFLFQLSYAPQTWIWVLVVRHEVNERTEDKKTPASANKQDFNLFLDNLLIYSLTAYHSGFQLTLISIFLYPCFCCLSTWQLLVSLWDWFEFSCKDWWALDHLTYNKPTFYYFWLKYVSRRGQIQTSQMSRASTQPSYSPGSVSAQTAKPHKPPSDHTLLTTTLTWEESSSAVI